MTNEQIATEVMGWRVEGPDDDRGFTWYSDDGGKLWNIVNNLPDFLNDHNAAMMVVEKMREDGYIFELTISNHITKAEFMKCAEDGSILECNYMFDAEASVCELICSAALKAKGG